MEVLATTAPASRKRAQQGSYVDEGDGFIVEEDPDNKENSDSDYNPLCDDDDDDDGGGGDDIAESDHEQHLAGAA